MRRYQRELQASQDQLLAPLLPAEREVFMDLLARLVEGNNETTRTALRPGGITLGAGRRQREAASRRTAARPAGRPAAAAKVAQAKAAIRPAT